MSLLYFGFDVFGFGFAVCWCFVVLFGRFALYFLLLFYLFIVLLLLGIGGLLVEVLIYGLDFAFCGVLGCLDCLF